MASPIVFNTIATQMIAGAGFIFALTASSAWATATLDCSAPPYYFSFIVSHDDGAQSFSFHSETELLSEGHIKKFSEFDLVWTNPASPAGNHLRFNGRITPELDVAGQVEGEKGHLVVNGKAHELVCDWSM